MKATLESKKELKGEITVPGDKSISHRALILSAIAEGKSAISGFLMAEDCLATANAFQALGLDFTPDLNYFELQGVGLRGLKEPPDVLNAQNSGTTIRLLTGLLSAQDFYTVITGDESLRKRPMKRVIEPLSKMGALIFGRNKGELAPLSIIGQKLKPFEHRLEIASAQLKSAILLAGLFCEGVTSVTEPFPSRDHTERMLSSFGADIEKEGLTVRIKGGARLQAQKIKIPGDFSAAAFWIVAALITPNSSLYLKGVGLNPTRTGLISVLTRMGARIKVFKEQEVCGEPQGDLLVESSFLRGTTVGQEEVPLLIDEIPVLTVAMSLATGESKITGAQELRYKESDRLKAIATELKRMGAMIEELPDGLIIYGREKLQGAEVLSYNDHRIAMSLAVAALAAQDKTVIEGIECISISYPHFLKELESFS